MLKVVLTEHARVQMRRRGLDETVVLGVAQAPEQRSKMRPGRELRQSRVNMPDGKLCLVRVVVDLGTNEDEVVTAYCTSKIYKYWRSP